MSERMTDDDVIATASRLGMGKVTREQVLALASVVAGEVAREKDATIKALADALERTGASGRVTTHHREGCVCIACEATAALRLAGRLP